MLGINRQIMVRVDQLTGTFSVLKNVVMFHISANQ